MAVEAPLQNKVALVSGGSRGIGAATAQALARQGAFVALSYVSASDAAADVVRKIEEAGGRAAAFKAD